MTRPFPSKAAAALAVLFFSGCATLPKNFEATPSQAIAQTEKTTLGDSLKPHTQAHPGQSGFEVLSLGREAFLSRIALADLAEKTIDCQYFIWKGDSSGVLLIDRLLKAANRGVRVRLLLDDMTSHGKDLGLAALNQHGNIEIRIFNPLGRRYYFGLFRTLALAFHAGRMTNRMHNKIFAVDNQVGIIGGRNIADEYFGIDKRSNFRDMDLLAAGPVVAEISGAFDSYWNSPWAVPFEVFKTQRLSARKMEKKKSKLEKDFKKMESKFPYRLDWSRESMMDVVRQKKTRLVWAAAHVVCDPPDKAWKKAHLGTTTSHIVQELNALLENSRRDIVVVSPYFIVPKESIKKMEEIGRKGVSLTLFTNSLRSTDAVPVVAMYRKIRNPMVEAGVHVYEMRPDAASRKDFIDPSAAKARLSLHAKVVVFDRQTVFVGTFNVDPRSEYLNTEVGLLVESDELAGQVADLIATDLSESNSYAVGLNYSDPGAGWWLRFKAGFLSLLPISGQL